MSAAGLVGGIASVGWLRAQESDNETATQTPEKDAMTDSITLDPNPSSIVPFELDEAQWRERLSEEAFYVLRKEGTERPFTSELNDEKRDGEFVCAGCGLALFKTDKKCSSLI